MIWIKKEENINIIRIILYLEVLDFFSFLSSIKMK